jgi:hypothetical protein
MIMLLVAVIAMVSFWRQLLVLLLTLVMIALCLGLYAMIEMIFRG